MSVESAATLLDDREESRSHKIFPHFIFGQMDCSGVPVADHGGNLRRPSAGIKKRWSAKKGSASLSRRAGRLGGLRLFLAWPSWTEATGMGVKKKNAASPVEPKLHRACAEGFPF